MTNEKLRLKIEILKTVIDLIYPQFKKHLPKDNRETIDLLLKKYEDIQ